MVYCQKCGKKNKDDAQFCIKCGNSLYITTKESYSFEKQIDDFAEEVEQLGKKASKTIEKGVKTVGKEVKHIGKKVEKVVKEVISSTDTTSKTEAEEYKRLYRSGRNKYIVGVCGGVAEYFKIDPILVRIIWVIIVFFPPGLGIILYILFWIFVPRNPSHNWG
ncbi:MAG: PspC domain-containing protein [Thermoplasmatota archaeon]